MSRLLTLHDPAEAQAYYAAGLWRDATFYALLARNAAERPAAKALRDSTRHLNWAELKDWVDAIADAFHEAGVRTGERVALWASNREIGRASCRERVCQYVVISGVAGHL